MKRLPIDLCLAAGLLMAGTATFSFSASAQEAAETQTPGAELAARVAALDANPELDDLAALERLQARQAVAVLAAADRDNRISARYVAERRVQIAEVAARTEAMRREIDRLQRVRSQLIVQASRRDAARARAEAERLRIQARIRAEEAARLRRQAAAGAEVMQDVEAALQGVAGVQSAKLSAARKRQEALARQEAALLAAGSLPPSTSDSRGEVFHLPGNAFAADQAKPTAAATAQIRTLAAYIQAGTGASVRVEGHAGNSGDRQADLELAERRASAVRKILVEAGVDAASIQAVGRGDVGQAAGHGVEIILSF